MMDLSGLLALVKSEYEIDAFTFRNEETGNVGITIEGPESVIQEKILPLLTEMIKKKLLGGLFKNGSQTDSD